MKAIFFAIALIALLAGFYFWQIRQRSGKEYAVIAFGNVVFRVEVVRSEEARQRGLSGRESIPANGGVLFLFGELGDYAIWMKDMRFPIDIIWIRSGRVVHIVKNAPPPDTGTPDARLAVYRSRGFADTILEVHAGTVDRLGIQIASLVEITERQLSLHE